jgi:hypothetical protein
MQKLKTVIAFSLHLISLSGMVFKCCMGLRGAVFVEFRISFTVDFYLATTGHIPCFATIVTQILGHDTDHSPPSSAEVKNE